MMGGVDASVNNGPVTSSAGTTWGAIHRIHVVALATNALLGGEMQRVAKSCMLSFGVLVAIVASAALPSAASAAGRFIDGCEISPNPYVCTYQNYTQEVNGTPALSHYCRSNTTIKNPPEHVYSLYNFCPWRVWLHQYANGSGWSYCIDGGMALETLVPSKYTRPGNIYISSNESRCR